MAEFITVTHPDLPGQTARMVNPRNGWVPLEDALGELTVPELRKRADKKGVDLTGAKKKGDIVAAISASVETEPDGPAGDKSTHPEKE